MRSTGARPWMALLLLLPAIIGAAPRHTLHAPAPITLGALYPLQLGAPPVQEYHGLQTAVAMINARGGVKGRAVALTTDSVNRRENTPGAVTTLVRRHVPVIIGSSESLIALPASEEAQAAGIIYWESGAVATMLTEPGHPDVFRTVTTGQTLGRAAADYAAHVVAPRLHMAPRAMRIAVVAVHDVYGQSVAAAQIAETRRLGMKLVRTDSYYYHPGLSFVPIVRSIKVVHPTVVLVAAYLQDAIAFRRETLRQHLRVGAMIGTSSSFCMPAFGRTLGRDAVGLFASDKPDIHINPRALSPAANHLRLAANAWYRRHFHADMTGPAVAGFVAGWVLLHDVLPHASSLTTAAIRRAALSVDLPRGSEINGAGIKFAGPGQPDEGQNLRATSVVWQWQRPGHAVVVYPAAYAMGRPRWIPLPADL